MRLKAFSALVLSGCALAACGPGAGPKGVSLETQLVVEEAGPKARYSAVVTSSPGLSAKTQPVPFEMIPVTSRCRVPRASSGAKIAYIYTYGGGDNAPVHHAYAGEDSSTNTRMQVARMAASAGDDEMFSAGSAVAREMEALAKAGMLQSTRKVDVFITETERPVFLVLTSYDSLLWNVQLAPGATLDGVAIISYRGGILANGPEADRVGFLNFHSSPHSGCYVSPRGRAIPVADRIASAREINPNVDLGSYPDQWREDIKASNEWYSRILPRLVGGRADIILDWADGHGFEGVLVGPVPDTPFESQPITRLQAPSHVQPVWGSRQHAREVLGLDDL